MEDEASEEERHSKRSSDSLIFLDGLRMMYGGGRSGRGYLGLSTVTLQFFHMGLSENVVYPEKTQWFC